MTERLTRRRTPDSLSPVTSTIQGMSRRVSVGKDLLVICGSDCSTMANDSSDLGTPKDQNKLGILSGIEGRKGPGRPRKGESAWLAYTRGSKSEAMRLLGWEAEQRGHSMLGFAELIDVDLRVLRRYFDSECLASKTIRRIVKVLGYASIVARALANELTPEDIRAECKEIARRLVFNEETFGANMLRAREGFLAATRANDVLTRSVCKASILMRNGLSGEHYGANPILGNYLGAIEYATLPHGFSLRPFVQNEGAVAERKREGMAWLILLIQTLGLTERDVEAINRLLYPHIVSMEVAQVSESEYRVTEQVPSISISFDALNAARDAFRAYYQLGPAGALEGQIPRKNRSNLPATSR